MFRKRGLLIGLAASMLALCSCSSQPAAQTASPSGGASPSAPSPVQSVSPSQPAAPASPEASPEETPTPEEASLSGEFSMDDLALVIDGTSYKVKDNASDLLAALGDGYEYSEQVSCVFDGYDKVYTYPAVEVATIPDGDNDLIDMIVLLDDTYETQRGIKVGASKADVEAAYGDGYFMDGPYMTYTISGDPSDIESPRCYFELDEGDTVLYITIHFPTVES